ncbi:MAG TPA: SCO family protein [Mycobacteriales bacterium]|nr:SCO family protein [Mycobacteriales bacterium]
MRSSRLACLLAAVCVLGLVGCSSASRPLAELSGTGNPAALRGDVLNPPTVAAAIDLPSDLGGRYDLARSTHDRITLVYFGYTHCPDVCPTIMADTAQALRESSPTVRSKVTVVFVTVDPKRDTMPVLRRWLAHFNPAFVGLRGTIAQVIEAQRTLDVPVSKVTPRSKNGYTVQHSAELLAFTPDGKAHVLYTDGPTMISDLRHDLAILASDKSYGA